MKGRPRTAPSSTGSGGHRAGRGTTTWGQRERLMAEMAFDRDKPPHRMSTSKFTPRKHSARTGNGLHASTRRFRSAQLKQKRNERKEERRKQRDEQARQRAEQAREKKKQLERLAAEGGEKKRRVLTPAERNLLLLFRKAVANTALTETQLFSYFDRNNSNKITFPEFDNALVKLRLGLDERDTKMLFRVLDVDGSRCITRAELSKVMALKPAIKPPKDTSPFGTGASASRRRQQRKLSGQTPRRPSACPPCAPAAESAPCPVPMRRPMPCGCGADPSQQEAEWQEAHGMKEVRQYNEERWLNSHTKAENAVRLERAKQKKELQQIKSWFHSLDDDGSGSIGLQELCTPMLALGVARHQDDVRKILENADINHNGQIEQREFVRLLMAEEKNSQMMHDTIHELEGTTDQSELSLNANVLKRQRRKLLDSLVENDSTKREEGGKVMRVVEQFYHDTGTPPPL